MNIWHRLKKPFTVLAPMEDVTDTVFRRIISGCGAPDLFYTEFTSCDGMLSPGRLVVSQRLLYTEAEHPIIAQVWGNDPKNFSTATKEIREMGFDGIDINMGCPVDKIVKQGACSALIKNPKLALEIIDATKQAAGDMPVSVKTRLGFDRVMTDEWVALLLECDLDALVVHGRIASEMSTKPADWDEIGKVVKMRDEMGLDTVIVGNGDVKSFVEVKMEHDVYGVDGVMIGRGVFDNPWIFNSQVNIENVSLNERLELMIKHIDLFVEVWGDSKNYAIMKKFFKIYVKGFEGAAEFRDKLMNSGSLMEARIMAVDLLSSVKSS